MAIDIIVNPVDPLLLEDTHHCPPHGNQSYDLGEDLSWAWPAHACERLFRHPARFKQPISLTDKLRNITISIENAQVAASRPPIEHIGNSTAVSISVIGYR
jgi:hypothetical protein